jgi:hypothetical protein
VPELDLRMALRHTTCRHEAMVAKASSSWPDLRCYPEVLAERKGTAFMPLPSPGGAR